MSYFTHLTSDWEVVIGLETHVQLMTQTKMFSSISTQFGNDPNSQAGFVDLALPGTLPKPQAKPIEFGIKFGLAVNGNINKNIVFSRKNYFYPDLPKGYQISQLESPIVEGGYLLVREIAENGEENITEIPLTRAHLEEDAGKSMHDKFLGSSAVDLNRAGIPLLEIVTEPKIKSAAQAVAYARTLHALVVWIGISDGNMQEGSFRCDVNISIKKKSAKELGTRVEIKNLNSFKFLESAIYFEIDRQISVLENGGTLIQETRLFDPETGSTRVMRGKENAQDYRYFPDPDLFPIKISSEYIESIRVTMPELPDILQKRFMREYFLNENDVRLVTANREIALYYENLINAFDPPIDKSLPKIALNWLCGEVVAYLKKDNLKITAACVTPAQLARLIEKIVSNTISNKAAKEVFYELWHQSSYDVEDVDQIISSKELTQLCDHSTLEAIISEVLGTNLKLVAECQSGKLKALNALVGQVMKMSQGKANPSEVNRCLRDKLELS